MRNREREMEGMKGTEESKTVKREMKRMKNTED